MAAEKEGGVFEDGAVAVILQQTLGYPYFLQALFPAGPISCRPYFLQEWGKLRWNVASESPITAADTEQATRDALAELDASVFRVRFERLTPAEKRYMRATAERGIGRYRSCDIAEMIALAGS